MNTANVLTAEKAAELKKRGIDYSDIPEITEDVSQIPHRR